MSTQQKVVFTEPAGTFDNYGHYKLPLLGPLYLATILKDAGYNAKVYAESFGRIYDDNFGAHKKKTIEILEGLIRKNLSELRWSAQARDSSF